jgi:hypothetical protein
VQSSFQAHLSRDHRGRPPGSQPLRPRVAPLVRDHSVLRWHVARWAFRLHALPVQAHEGVCRPAAEAARPAPSAAHLLSVRDEEWGGSGGVWMGDPVHEPRPTACAPPKMTEKKRTRRPTTSRPADLPPPPPPLLDDGSSVFAAPIRYRGHDQDGGRCVVQPSLKGDDDAVSSYTIKECNTTRQCTLSTYRTRTLHVLEGVITKGSLYTRMCVHAEKVHPRDQRGCYRRRAPFPFFFPCFLPPPPPPPPSPRPPLLPRSRLRTFHIS